ncbi:hypothetical protein P879_11929 [Paragonimus westermani]|uniref:Uncharacterized protein n=1 Tax=Paragonimus westermani TaxID=34504 RepID=A0A8T0D860_9TREM|nr:hypothetical protein P879_11929 [Paragonimus westermani]
MICIAKTTAVKTNNLIIKCFKLSLHIRHQLVSTLPHQTCLHSELILTTSDADNVCHEPLVLSPSLYSKLCMEIQNDHFSFQIRRYRDLPILACCLEDTSFVQPDRLRIREYRIVYRGMTPMDGVTKWGHLRNLIDKLVTDRGVCTYNAYWVDWCCN